MKTVGETLRSVREKQGKTLEQIAAQTSIKKEFLHALEAGEFSLLPSPVAVQGFISTYALILGIEPQTALALLRRDFELTRSHVLPKHLIEGGSKQKKIKSNRFFALCVLSVCFLTILVFTVWSYLQLHQAPSLTITSPKDGAVLSSNFTVRGVTASDATLEVDSQTVSLTQDGEFAVNESLSAGDHIVTVIAKNRSNQETIKQISVHVQD